MSEVTIAPPLSVVNGTIDHVEPTADRTSRGPRAGGAGDLEMVGRTAELAELVSTWDDAREHGSRWVMLGGEAGIGKSTLLSAFADAVEPVRVITGQCVPLGGAGLAFAPITWILHDLVALHGIATIREWAGAGWPALHQLIPSLVDTSPAGPLAASNSLSLFEAIPRIWERAAHTEPLAIVIEDLHWADDSTLALIRFAARALTDSPIMIICTYRTDELTRRHPLRPFLAETLRQRGVRRVEMSRLDRAEVGQLLGLVTGREVPDEVVGLIFEHSQGIPYFAAELVTVTTGGCLRLPDTLRDALNVRVQRLSDAAQSVLRVISTAGNRIDHPVLTAICDVPGLDLALREAVDSHVLVTDANGYAFRHALLREVIHDDLLPGEHTRLHATLAQALSEHPELVQDLGQPVIAHHWLAAHELDRAFASALEIAQSTSIAHAETLKLYELALELWDRVPNPERVLGPRARVLLKAASCADEVGEHARGLALVDSAIQLTDGAAEPLLLSHMLVTKGRLLKWGGGAEAVRVLTRAIELTDGFGPVAERMYALNALAKHHMIMYAWDESIAAAREAQSIAEHLGKERFIAHALITMGSVLKDRGDEAGSLECFARAEAGAVTNPATQLRYHINYSDALYVIGRHADAVEVAREGVSVATGLGFERFAGAMIAGNMAEPLMMLGRWDESEKVLRRAIDFHPADRYLVQLEVTLARLLTWQGKLEEAAQLLVVYEPGVWNRTIGIQQEGNTGIALAELALARRDPERAWRYVVHELELELGLHCATVRYQLVINGALALRDLAGSGRVDAKDLAERNRLLRDAVASAPVIGATGAYRVIVDPLLEPGAVDQLRTAFARRDSEPPAVTRPRIGLVLARELMAAGERAEAEQVALESIELARSMGASLLVDQLDDLGERAGFWTRGVSVPENLASLTARELEVLRLVASGRSNAQIGAELFIAGKTASVHVSNILAKLGVSSRGEAAAVAHTSGMIAAS